MNKSILILEQNAVVQGLVASALDMDGLTLHHEFNPSKYLERARSLRPDLILLGNADPSNNYSICRQLKTSAGLADVPLVLMAGSKEQWDNPRLQQLKVAGLVRKPFEASDLQQQVSKHLNLLDLIGSAYEYAKTQSAQEDAPNPLAQLDVLEPDVVDLMRDAGPAQGAVPEVDFSHELRQEADRAGWDEAAAGAAFPPEPAAQAEPFGDEPFQAEPFQAEPFGDEPFGDVPGLEELDEGPVESFAIGTVHADAAADGRAGIEGLPELGPEDLLEEEGFEESRLAPQGFDQPLGGAAPRPREPSALDRIEVELSGEDLSLEEPPPPRAVRRDPLADDLDSVSQGAAQPPLGDLPPAVRRMMEHQSVFPKMPLPGAARPTPPPPRTPPPRDEMPPAVRRMMEQKSIFTPPAGREPPPEPEEQGLVEPGPDDAAFAEAVRLSAEESSELLDMQGAIDEEQERLGGLPSPLEDLPPLDSADPDLLSLTSSEELTLDALDTQPELQEALAGQEEDEQEISIDEDEEELILSSLDSEALEEVGPAPAESGSLYPLQEEVSLEGETLTGMEEVPDLGEPPALDSRQLAESMVQAEQDMDLMMEQEEDLLLRELDGAPDVQAAPPRTMPPPGKPPRTAPPGKPASAPPLGGAPRQPAEKLPSRPEAFPPEPMVGLEALPPELTFDLDDADFAEAALELEPESLDGGLPPLGDELSPLDIGLEPLGGELPGALDESGTDLLPLDEEPTLPGLLDSDIEELPPLAPLDLEPLAFEMDAAQAFAEDSSAGGQDGGGLEDGGLDDFESALAQLKGEIAANPEGERLDDVLRMEQLQSMIGKLEFTIPQSENVMARAMGLYGLPGQAAAKPAQPAQAPAPHQVAALAAGMAGLPPGAAELPPGANLDSLLDAPTKARLSQVLDEIISISVRRAVREEMPRLVERLVKPD